MADNTDGNSGQDNGKTRKKSDKNMENYRKIVIADDSEADQRYKSDYRGRVQDRNVTIKLEPMYALTYYEKLSDVKRMVHYHKYIDELNHSKMLPKPLRITNMESPLTEEQVRFHFALIDAPYIGYRGGRQECRETFYARTGFLSGAGLCELHRRLHAEYPAG